ncbi:MAG: hypothetical protein F9K27_07850 [Anaerolineae bacterium]|nr:MAG: hypothetical protein F9K27_07850 [Anaerolineae bacterium]
MIKRLLVLLIIAVSAMHGQAQQPPPEEAARAFYDAVLNAPPDSYGQAASYLCLDATFTELEYQALTTARGGIPVDISGLTFTSEMMSETEALVSISGSVTNTTGAIIQLPAEPIRMTNEGTWKICPPSPPVEIISAADTGLTEDAAFEVAINFYEAFYTGDTSVFQNLVCAQKILDLAQISLEKFGQFTLSENNEWGISGAEPVGYALKINTFGAFKVNRDDGAVVALQDRDDFPNPILIRENGWKFCGSYREGERSATNFLTGFYRYATEDLDRYTCREYRTLLREPAEINIGRDVADIRVPPEFFVVSAENPNEASVLNLEQTIILFGDGQVTSVASTFGSSARLVYEDNRWKWCQLTQGQLAEMEATEEPN